MQDPNNPDDKDIYNEFDDFGDFDENDPAQGGDEFLMPDNSGYDESVSGEFGGEDAYGFESETDDFGDAAMDDGWSDEEGDAAAATSGKGGGRLGGLSFNTMVIGAAVLVGAGVLVYQVMTTKPAMDGADRFQSVLNFTGATDGPVLGQAGEDAQAGKQAPADGGAGFLDNPDVLNNLERETAQQGGNLPMPSPISNEADEDGLDQAPLLGDAGPGDVLTPMPSATTPADTAIGGIQFDPSQQVPRGPDQPAPAAPSASSALDVIRQAQQQREDRQQAEAPAVPAQDTALIAETLPVPQPQEQQPPAPAAETAPAPAPAAPAAPQDAERLAALTAELTEANNRASSMEKELGELRSRSAGNVAELEKEVARLKAELEQARSAAKDTSPAPVKAEAPKAAPKPAAAPKPKAAPRQASAAPAARSGSVQWELRAAQPGRAWVSRKGQREMQSVEAGDSLAGIGQIMRIEYANGRWTVFGTQGAIHQ